jgi:hypothetical protein
MRMWNVDEIYHSLALLIFGKRISAQMVIIKFNKTMRASANLQMLNEFKVFKLLHILYSYFMIIYLF